MTERDEPIGPDAEVPEADALEQRTAAADPLDDPDDTVPADRDTLEADDADLAEQSRAVDVDEDEYR